jgi:hypothetical protein
MVIAVEGHIVSLPIGEGHVFTPRRGILRQGVHELAELGLVKTPRGQ